MKAICKRLDYIDGRGIKRMIPSINISEIYDVKVLANEIVSVNGYLFSIHTNGLIENGYKCNRLFSDYFITVAEYRQNQINLILE